MVQAPRYAFGDVELDTGRVLLLKGDAPVTLEPKALAVLQLLVERAPQVVDKAEIFAVVWKDTAVTDNALTRIVAQLRRALGDDARDPRYIATVSARGYRLLPDVRRRDAQAPPAATAPAPPAANAAAPRSAAVNRRWLVAVAALLLLSIVGGYVAMRRTASAASRGGRRGARCELAGQSRPGHRRLPRTRAAHRRHRLRRLCGVLARRRHDCLQLRSIGCARDLRGGSRGRLGADVADPRHRPPGHPAGVVARWPPDRVHRAGWQRHLDRAVARRHGAQDHRVGRPPDVVPRRPPHRLPVARACRSQCRWIVRRRLDDLARRRGRPDTAEAADGAGPPGGIARRSPMDAEHRGRGVRGRRPSRRVPRRGLVDR